MIQSKQDLLNLIKTKGLVIKPFKKEYLGPVGMDLTLEKSGLNPDSNKEVNLTDTPLRPNELILVNSVEYLHLPNYLVGKIVNRSSVARLGVLVSLNADLVEPNFSGKLTFTIKNLSNREIWLKPGLRIAQLTLEEISSPQMEVKVLRYNSKTAEERDLCEEM